MQEMLPAGCITNYECSHYQKHEWERNVVGFFFLSPYISSQHFPLAKVKWKPGSQGSPSFAISDQLPWFNHSKSPFPPVIDMTSTHHFSRNGTGNTRRWYSPTLILKPVPGAWEGTVVGHIRSGEACHGFHTHSSFLLRFSVCRVEMMIIYSKDII